MRHSEKGEFIHSQSPLMHVDFHSFVQKENELTSFELASEFGLTLRDVQKIKKHLARG
ncbi:hypothetical protein [Anoxybacillus flavithermus]|nr:hypothetical protein [Anoxybacillus flavithermus]